MRALVKTASGMGNLELVEMAPPVPGPGEALVRVGPSGLCGTDLLLYDGVYRGRKRPVPVPLIVGHEASGEVIALAPNTTGPRPGTRVGIEAVTGCGQCHHCVRGNYNLCQHWHHIGLTRAGVLADFVVVPVTSLLPLPEQVTLESAAFLEPLATAVHTLERVKPAPGTTAAVVGPGPLGLLHLQVLQAAGVGPIVMYGRQGDETRLERAASLGAETFLGDRAAIGVHADAFTGGLGFGLSIEAGGTATAIQTALDIVAGEGTLVSLGIVPTTEIDVLQVMRKDLTWIGVVSSVRRHFAEAINLIQTRKVRPEELITHRLAVGDALAGFQLLRHREAVKVMFSMSSSAAGASSAAGGASAAGASGASSASRESRVEQVGGGT
jgi:2-desacetyl-2-hydroxyethyl bacteriochlorophyllide A dehydrogenase